jgi:hypothetical protein
MDKAKEFGESSNISASMFGLYIRACSSSYTRKKIRLGLLALDIEKLNCATEFCLTCLALVARVPADEEN